MTAFQFESNNAIETAKADYCKENHRDPNLNWDDLDEIFSLQDDFDEFTTYDPFSV